MVDLCSGPVLGDTISSSLLSAHYPFLPPHSGRTGGLKRTAEKNRRNAGKNKKKG